MTLAPGTRLGPYEVTAALGAGGMGEVFRARDTKLNRDVAIKVLPAAFADDPERLARFTREARTLASLNHPNIATIYGIEELPAAGAATGGSRALVMELIEGEDLSAHIARGPIPIGEALPIARQIAEAIEAAHEQGIVHRDLKPANIKIRTDGTVKVLDFGLAKAMDAPGPRLARPPGVTDAELAGAEPGRSVEASPTLTHHGTTAGMIIGTAAYMSPEQAMGKPVNRRADIWAFGVVLYEILSGQRLFKRESVSEILAAVLKDPLPMGALPAATPPRLRRLIGRCLDRDLRTRLRDIGEARIALTEMVEREGSTIEATPVERDPATGRTPPWRTLLPWTLAALSATIAIFLGLRNSGTSPGSSRSGALRVSIVHAEGSEVGAPAISPDGKRVAYRARQADGMPLLWVRDLTTGDEKSLPGTEGAYLPFWSPDSRDLGFASGAALKRVPAEGGPVRILVENLGTFGGYGGTWGTQGSIVFSGQEALLAVASDGGATRVLTKLPSADWAHMWPSFLPDGRRFLFTAKLWTRSAEASEQGIYLGSLDSPIIHKLLPDLSSASYAPPGYLVFAREGVLTTAPFDLAEGRVTGPPVAIGGAVATDAMFNFAAISASKDGSLAVRLPPAVVLSNSDHSAAFNAELRLVDRNGAGSRVGSARLFAYFMALNPMDGRTLATGIFDPRASTEDLWLLDLKTDSIAPLSTTRGFSGNPVWSKDGRRLAYTYQPPGQLDDPYIKDIPSAAIRPVLETPGILEHVAAWSHDEKFLLVFTADDKGTYLSSWSFAARTLTRLVGPRAFEGAAFSPKDNLVAFTSGESGRYEAYVTTFPDHERTWPLTSEGGRVLSWRNDGREILVATLSGHITAYPVSTEGGFSHGDPKVLIRDVGSAAAYSTATPDHSRILIRVNPDAAKDKGEIQLFFGWQDALRESRR